MVILPNFLHEAPSGNQDMQGSELTYRFYWAGLCASNVAGLIGSEGPTTEGAETLRLAVLTESQI